MISAISPRGKIHFSFLSGNLNSALFIDYLKKLMHDIPGPIFLIVTGTLRISQRKLLNLFKVQKDG